MVSLKLFPFVKKLVGIDISEGAVAKFNEKARSQGFATEDANAFALNLQGEDSELGGEKFDVVTVFIILSVSSVTVTFTCNISAYRRTIISSIFKP